MTKENIQESLRIALQQRLESVIAHLHTASWPDDFCFTGQHDAPPREQKSRWQWNHPLAIDAKIVRSQARSWSQKQLSRQYDRPVLITEALNALESNLDALVNDSVNTIAACVDALVGKEYRQAVLSRERLARDWPWPLEHDHGGTLLHALLALCPSAPPQEALFTQWPSGVSGTNVGVWAKNWLDKTTFPVDEGGISDLLQQATLPTAIVFNVHPGLSFTTLATPALALLHVLEEEVKEEQKRKFIAIDTCKEHTKLVEAWRDLPKSKEVQRRTSIHDGRLELILPDKKEKRHFQLSFLWEEDTIASQISRALKEWRSWAGLRHWVAFQSLLTANQRLGWVRWNLDEHLKTMGLCKERRRRPKIRQATAEMVELFTKIEIAVYDETGNIRERRPLVQVGSAFERLVGSQWELEGLELKVNELLYRGVRDQKTGKIGQNWWPTPKELPHIDHDKQGAAIALGMALPARWRMELSKSGKTYVDLKGDSLLRAAGLPYQQTNVVSTWRSIERNLAELQRRRGLESWEWLGEPDLGTVCRLHAPKWAVDRVAHGVPPRESKPTPTALTGSELKVWRRQEKLTQADAADKLAVTTRTIQRAEAMPDKPLSKKLRNALSAIGDAGTIHRIDPTNMTAQNSTR